jgi:hypothetical protein
MRRSAAIPWYVRLVLFRPERVVAHLARLPVEHRPTPWQLCLGVLRLWHRTILRPETVGLDPAGRVRPTWRARLLRHKALRLPFLLAERAVVPLDFTGLASPPERVIRHLLGAHHQTAQLVYDLELLAHHGRLPELHLAVRAVLAADTPRTRFLRDLTVYEGYHEALLAEVERALPDGPKLDAAAAIDPDLSFAAYLRWCAAQPTTPAATVRAWRAGRFRFDGGLEAAP